MSGAIYVGQFGYVWKLRTEQWIEICKAGIDGWTYDLTPFRRLRRAPKWLLRDEECHGCFSPTRNDVVYVEPLDWEPEDFAEHLESLQSTGFANA